ncbi:MAG: hypothetical protein QG567_1400 [Campylobacterota bacterium]|nr:hypothetical protein [Campylobacterota bacterium]
MKKVLIIDIKRKYDIKKLSDIFKSIQFEQVLSLTPFSSYVLDCYGIKYQTFHDIKSIVSFRELVLNKYNHIKFTIGEYHECSYLLRNLMQIVTHEEYIGVINSHIESMKNREITYLTDTSKDFSMNELRQNKYSLLHLNKNIANTIILNETSKFFHFNSNFFKKIKSLKKKGLIKKILNKILNIKVGYENVYLSNFIKRYKVDSMQFKKIDTVAMLKDCRQKCIDCIGSDIDYIYESLFDDLERVLENFKPKEILNFFTYIADSESWIKYLLLRKNKKTIVFTQHGSYLYEHFFYKYCEALPECINLVSNDYTKQKFLKLKSNNVYTIGSENLNYRIYDSSNEFDFLYITYNVNYSGYGVYIESDSCMHSMDGNNIFKKHQEIINLFGTKFKDKKICIKVQPGIFAGTMLYVPFLELSKEYKNITIEVSTPISSLIQKSKYIISDYFSSEFINRELHYKRDIILFKGAPLPLPEDTLEDMEKMFILVETVDDLKAKVENIEEITKDRPRYDDIIEYYSSKKCDTKKAVAEILEKELNARA